MGRNRPIEVPFEVPFEVVSDLPFWTFRELDAFACSLPFEIAFEVAFEIAFEIYFELIKTI